MPLYLIRHSSVAASSLCYGQSDVPLAASFNDEAQALSHELERTFADDLPRVWSSPSQRCVQLARTLKLNAQLDPRLMELSFGNWEGKRWDEIDGPEARFWGDNWQSAAPPNGESLPDLISRVDEFIHSLPAGDHLLLCHAGPIRVIWHLLGGQTLDTAFATPVPYAKLLAI